MKVTENHITYEEQKIWDLLHTVQDPELPVLSVTDLGIIRKVSHNSVNTEITITPTYSGCPAMDVIAMNIRFALLQNGYKNINIISVLSPAWTTNWMTEAGKRKLKEYGIAPPAEAKQQKEIELFADAETVQCPLCNSYHTARISEFGSTACKSLYKCMDCQEPFDHFKCH